MYKGICRCRKVQFEFCIDVIWSKDALDTKQQCMIVIISFKIKQTDLVSLKLIVCFCDDCYSLVLWENHSSSCPNLSSSGP